MPSSPQTVTTRGVFDYLVDTAGKALTGKTVNCTLNFNGASVTSPIVNVGELQQSTTTDQNGFWRFLLAPNDTLTPTGTLYTIQTPVSVYDISVPSGGADVQSSSILSNVPSVLSPALTGLTGPITVTGNETITGTLTVQGTTALQGAVTTDVTFNGNAFIRGPDPWFDAKSFGATGNGSTDDTTSLQNWVNAFCGTGATAVGIGYLPPGNYKVTGTLTVPTTLTNGFVLMGAGRSVTTITQATQNVDTFKITKNPGRVTQVAFKDLSIVGPNAGTSGFGINCEGDLSLSRVTVTLCWTGVRLFNSFYSEVEDSWFNSNLQDGLFLDTQVSGFRSRGNRYSNNGRYGVVHPSATNVASSQYVFIQDFFETNATRGIEYDVANDGFLHALEVWGCWFETASLTAAHYVRVGATNPPHQVVLIGNRMGGISGGVIIGLEIDNCKTAFLAGNQFPFSNTTGASLTLAAGAKTVMEIGNYYRGTVSRNAASQGYVIGDGQNSESAGPFGHLIAYGPAPTLGALQTGINSQSITGNDIRGRVTVATTGSAPLAGNVVAIVTFAKAFDANPVVVLGTESNSAGFAVSALGTTGFSIFCTVNLANTTSYSIPFMVVG